jgi:DMSO/TMAO reductase YedYZ molybdopterin-dependent catalytic subunit
MSSSDKSRQNDSQQRLFIERSHVLVKRSGIPLRGKEPVYDNGRRVVLKVEGMSIKRRTLLQVGGLSLLAGLTGGCDSVGGVLGRMFAVPPRETLYFTPNDTFYVVNYMESPFNISRDLNVEQWRLNVTGEVKKPVTLGWRDILNRDSFDQVVTLECIDTLPGGDSLGNAQWRGISLKKLLQDVGADEETARDVVFRAADGYDDSIPFSRAMRDDVMLAYLMNGEKLPKEHGFPLRLVVPGLYGIKNVKWIIEIEVYNGDYKGYWQRKGWTDDGTIKIFSRIDSPGHYQPLRGPEHVFRGIAFGGPHTISKVEVSVDRAKSWQEAELEPTLSPYSWVIWNYRWHPPKPGKYQVAVRATDAKGNLQIAELVRPQPAGASGLHTIIADVEEV